MSESMNFDKLHKEYKKTQKYVCQNPGCGQTFGIRTRPDRDSSKFCSSQCAGYYLAYIAQERQKEYNKNPNKCQYCSTEILWDNEKYKSFYNFLKRKYCSRSCSAKNSNTNRIITVETKNKMSQKAKENKSGFCSSEFQEKQKKEEFKLKRYGEKKLYVILCHNENCKKEFKDTNTNKKYCSTKCWKQCSGGYRQGAGHSKGGYYKNIWCDSTWELAYLIYCLDHHITIKRNTEKFHYIYKDKKHHYIPDFIVNGKLVEIKGWYTELVDIKIASVTKPIEIMYKDDLKYIFEYVKNKTGLQVDDFFSLYEDYVPEKRKCERSECNNEFNIVPSKKNNRYCSVSCGRMGKNNNKQGKNNAAKNKGKIESLYNQNPKYCLFCNEKIQYGPNVRILKYCSISCGAKDKHRKKRMQKYGL